jgi:hypothetical protein
LNDNWCTAIEEKGVKFKKFYVISYIIVTDNVFEKKRDGLKSTTWNASLGLSLTWKLRILLSVSVWKIISGFVLW